MVVFWGAMENRWKVIQAGMKLAPFFHPSDVCTIR